MDIKGVTLKNRIVMSPMCMYSSYDRDGKLQPFHFTLYFPCPRTSWSHHGGGKCCISRGRISDQDLGIWSDEHIEGFASLNEQIKAYGTKTAIQLAHAGRKAELDGDILAPSSIPFDEQSKIPAQMSIDQIKDTVQAFQDAAVRAKRPALTSLKFMGHMAI